MPSQQFSLKALAATIFATSVSAHMLMSSPVPYGKSTLNNSPLAADGSDFPCKQRSGVYDAEGASNVMAVGSTNTLSFIGTAVHGGGSCQVSLTTDLQPTKDSKWMVIKSIEGGCPADVPGNLDVGGATTPDPTTFTYTIPEGIAPGDYTIAWSWVNKVGNREFYMNCGPATITGAAKKRYAPNAPISKNKRQATFPDMFVANLDGVSNGCTTTEGIDIQYPDPGSDVTKAADANLGNPVGCSGGDGAAAASSPTASAAAGTATSAAGGASAAAASSPTATSASGGVFATGAASLSTAPAAATATVSPVPAAASSAPASVASAAPAAAPSSSSSSTSGAAVAGAACSPEGLWACSADGSTFQRCASGVWSVSMQMAAGTSCTPGTSDTLTENVTNAKRHMGFHARRSHQAYARLS